MTALGCELGSLSGACLRHRRLHVPQSPQPRDVASDDDDDGGGGVSHGDVSYGGGGCVYRGSAHQNVASVLAIILFTRYSANLASHHFVKVHCTCITLTNSWLYHHVKYARIFPKENTL